MTTTAVATVLMTADEARSCVSSIRSGLENVWLLVLELHEREGWRALGYDSWRECVRVEFAVSQSRAYQLLDLAQINTAISTIVENPSIPESHARELAILKDDHDTLREAYTEALVETDGKPKASDVRKVVDRKLGRPPKPAREKRSVTSAAERSDFADVSDDAAFAGNDAPDAPECSDNGSAVHGAPERWCQECNGRYRGDACPCLSVTAPEPEPKPSTTAPTYQPAARTSSVGVSKPATTTYRPPALSGPPPFTIASDAAGTFRAMADRWKPAQLADAIVEGFEPSVIRDLIAAGLDALTPDMLATVHQRIVTLAPISVHATPASDDVSAQVAGDLAAGRKLRAASRLVFEAGLDERGRKAIYDRLCLEFAPKSDRELVTGRAV